ncbi:MAG: glycyl-radical enzyme activating protein [Clostridia bacterium]|nr:glycyl-radical enzyme activating protein [Clostridia bacterium]
MHTATIFDIERASYVDGPGIRTTVFFKGCNLNCAWCHNPESQKNEPQMLFYADKCTGCGKCKEKCPNALEKCDLCGKCALYCPHDAREICGKTYTVAQVLNEVAKDKAFYEASDGGVTFSGGECMLQIDFLTEILKACKENGIHTAVDTAGCVSYDRFERILPYTDLFLYDVKCMDNARHKTFVGVGNDLILTNLRKLLKAGVRVWVRVPVIPDVNDTAEEMERLAAFLDTAGRPEKVELLPYHAMGEHKYTALGMEAKRFSVPDEETMTRLRAVFVK